MLRLLTTPRKTLINSDEVIANSSIQEPEPRHILAAIQIAEERFIKKTICVSLYNDFRDKKNQVVTDINKAFLQDLINENIDEYNLSYTADLPHVTLKNGDIVNGIELVANTFYVELWNEHLWKLCAEAVVYIASPANYSRFTGSGEQQNNPASIAFEGRNAASVDLDTMKWKLDKMLMDRIDPLISGLDEYLFQNRGNFPLLDCKNWSYRNTPNGISVERKTGWIHGIYDDERKTPCQRNTAPIVIQQQNNTESFYTKEQIDEMLKNNINIE